MNVLIPPLQNEDSSQNRFYLAFGKRAFDVLLGILLFPILIPTYILISLLVLFGSGFPIIFTQKRVGKNGKVFKMYKFRTMIRGASQLQKDYLHLNEVDGPVFKIRDDPRYTRIGKLLAQSGIDEILQLVNVITGNMSLVGPRPLPIAEEKQIPIQFRNLRKKVRPGITSSWVVSGAHSLSFLKWMQLDLNYIEETNLTKDIEIIIKTVTLMFKTLYREFIKIASDQS